MFIQVWACKHTYKLQTFRPLSRAAMCTEGENQIYTIYYKRKRERECALCIVKYNWQTRDACIYSRSSRPLAPSGLYKEFGDGPVPCTPSTSYIPSILLPYMYIHIHMCVLSIYIAYTYSQLLFFICRNKERNMLI